MWSVAEVTTKILVILGPDYYRLIQREPTQLIVYIETKESLFYFLNVVDAEYVQNVIEVACSTVSGDCIIRNLHPGTNYIVSAFRCFEQRRFCSKPSQIAIMSTVPTGKFLYSLKWATRNFCWFCTCYRLIVVDSLGIEVLQLTAVSVKLKLTIGSDSPDANVYEVVFEKNKSCTLSRNSGKSLQCFFANLTPQTTYGFIVYNCISKNNICGKPVHRNITTAATKVCIPLV